MIASKIERCPPVGITVSEAAIGLAIVILLFRVRKTVMADHLDLLKG